MKKTAGGFSRPGSTVPFVFSVLCALALSMVLLVCSAPGFAQTVGTAPPPSTQGVAPAARQPQFFMRLIPPRTTFVTDMTPQEADLMQQHAKYWAEQFKTGKVLIIGPVLDTKGPFGMAVLQCDTEAEARAMAENDPSVKAGLNKVELSPMSVFLRKQ
jgi:uncharacterized protein